MNPAPDSFCAVVVGAGLGRRLSSARRKAWVEVAGRPLWWHACHAFAGIPGLREVVLVVHEEDHATLETASARALLDSAGITKVVVGGERRQDSVLAGVWAAGECENVLVHDAARPLVKKERICALLAALQTHEGAFLAQTVPSTVKRVKDNGEVAETLPREQIRLASTPQGARRDRLLELLTHAHDEQVEVTDEAFLLEWGGLTPVAVEDDVTNIKVTTPEDLQLVRGLTSTALPRIGHGYDIHRLGPGGPLKLGGIEIEADVHLEGHSDGDCLLHAVAEALLGASGLPDIGEHFPDTDTRFEGADSSDLLRQVLQELDQRSLRPVQVDCSVILERPKLGAWKGRMKESLMTLLGLPADRVAVKARTAEGLDAIGRGEALAVHCTALVADQTQHEGD